MTVRTFVSFEVDELAFPAGGERIPPGRELAEFVSHALRRAGVNHDGPVERESWAWELRAIDGDVRVECIVGLTDDPPMQWHIHTYGYVPALRRWFSRDASTHRERVLTRWCEAIHDSLMRDGRIRNIRWYDQTSFERDHGETWAERPV